MILFFGNPSSKVFAVQVAKEISSENKQKLNWLFASPEQDNGAMQEIEQGLINETQQFLLSNSLELQLQLANKTQQYLTQRYSNGAGDFLSLLTNQQQTLQLERQVLAADYQQLKYRIQLLTSLSHGRFSTDKVIESGDEDE